MVDASNACHRNRYYSEEDAVVVFLLFFPQPWVTIIVPHIIAPVSQKTNITVMVRDIMSSHISLLMPRPNTRQHPEI